MEKPELLHGPWRQRGTALCQQAGAVLNGRQSLTQDLAVSPLITLSIEVKTVHTDIYMCGFLATLVRTAPN